MSTTKPDTMMVSAGSVRYLSDMRQLAGCLLAVGFGAIFHPMANVATLIGPNGTTVGSGVPLWGLIGGIVLMTVGTLAVFTGYNQLVHGWYNKNWTFGVIIFTQLVYIPYITDMTGIGKNARSGNAFIPAAYDPTEADVKFVGAMGILGVLTYGFCFVGSISFFLFSLHTYQTGKPQDRCASYFKGRAGFYCAVHCLAGITQLALGIFIFTNFQGGLLDNGPIGVAMFHINFPAIAFVIGFIQMVNGLWGIARSQGYLIFGDSKKDLSFQASIFLSWFLQLTLQALVQTAINPGGMAAGSAPSILGITIGLNIMPAFLDFKSRTAPEEITPDYYEIPQEMMQEPASEQSVEGGEDEKPEATEEP